MDYRKRFSVKPNRKVRLSGFDPGFSGKHESKATAQPETREAIQEMAKLQYQLYAEAKRSLLIVLQGLDGAGKDGTIRHVFTGMNPQACKVATFKQPTAEERRHDFLWRVHPHAPARGEVAVLNRSHYEDVLVARVHRLVPREEWSKRYELINDFERTLHVENDTTILKFFLHISKDEQLVRFAQRLEDPLRQWKISMSDYEERDHWDEYISAFEDVLKRTSTAHAPWFVIPSNHKWFRNLAVSQIVVETLKGMRLQLPKPTVDLDEIRSAYHHALRGAQGRGP
jgi:PPK2 family polyphosphate:nucleotide phosphotransferase